MCWSSEGVILGESQCVFFQRNCLGLHLFLRPAGWIPSGFGQQELRGTSLPGTRWGSGTPRSEISLLNGPPHTAPECGAGPPLGSATTTGPGACCFLESVLLGLLSPPFSDGAERQLFYRSVATWMGLWEAAGRVYPCLPRTGSLLAFFRAGGPPVPLGHLNPWTTSFANGNATLTVPFRNTYGNGMSGKGDIS